MLPFARFISLTAALLLAASAQASPHEKEDRSYRSHEKGDRSSYSSPSRDTQSRSGSVRIERDDDRRSGSVTVTREKTRDIRTRSYEGYRPAPLPKTTRNITTIYRNVILPPHRRPGYIIHTIPSVALSLTIGGLIYYYNDYLFYRHTPRGYVVVAPPIGAIVPVLPVGYVVLYRFGTYYYVYENSYYIWDDRFDSYRVVAAPQPPADDADNALYRPGNVVATLPEGAEAVTLNGVQYYRYKKVYFLPSVQNGSIVYIVVKLD